MVRMKVDKLATKKKIANARQLTLKAKELGLTLHTKTAYDIWDNKIEKIGLQTINVLCQILDCNPGALFEYEK